MFAHTICIQPQEPVLLLIVGHDVDESRSPLNAIDVFKLLEVDLHGLPVWSVHSQKMDALGILHLRRRLVSVEMRHACSFLFSFALLVLSSTKSNALEKWNFWILAKVKLLLRVKTSLED